MDLGLGIVGVLAVLQALEYGAIALFVVPRLEKLTDDPGTVMRIAQFGAAAFFIGSCLTQVLSAVHAFDGQPGPVVNSIVVDRILPNALRTLGGAAFIAVVVLKMDVRFNAKGFNALQREREELMHRLVHLATRDELTDLFNRRAFLDELAEHQKRVDRYGLEGAILYMDLDGFKTANDTYGHAVGDQVLVDIADKLRAALRKSDVIGRMGGDEFAVLLPKASHADAVATAAGLVSVLRGTGPDGVKVDASIGVASWEGAIDPHHVLEAADAAMYEAKRRGGDTHYARVPKGRAALLAEREKKD